MPTIRLSDEQVTELVMQLPMERKQALLIALARQAIAAEDVYGDEELAKLKDICARRGRDWELLTEEERTGYYVHALSNGEIEPERDLDDPEVIINEALREAKEEQIKNRERAVHVITQKNMLQNLTEQEERLIRNLGDRAEIARQEGNHKLAAQFVREKELHGPVLEQLRESLQRAEEASEAVKNAIRREEELFRVKTAEALAFKASMQQSRIMIDLNAARFDLASDDPEEAWERVAERFHRLREEALLRLEAMRKNDEESSSSPPP